MWSRRLSSSLFSNPLRANLLFRSHPSSPFSTSPPEAAARVGGPKRSLARRAVPIVFLSLTGGVILSAVNDLAIFHGCSSKAIEKASQNQTVVEALGEPILRGAWYNASVGLGLRRRTVSCTFPVYGPQRSAVFEVKAVRNGDDSWFSFLRHHDWDIISMEAIIDASSNEEQNQPIRVSLAGDPAIPGVAECRDDSLTSME